MFKSKEELIEAINLYCDNKDKCIEQYGETNNWDVSNVTNMQDIFKNSKFNGNISNWNVSNVTNMNKMFTDSEFNGDISKWDINNVIYGKEYIIKLGAKEKEEIKIIESIKEGYEECPVTKEIIINEYIKCKTCNKCFDIVVKEWIKNNNSCPYCRSKWRQIKIYSQQ